MKERLLITDMFIAFWHLGLVILIQILKIPLFFFRLFLRETHITNSKEDCYWFAWYPVLDFDTGKFYWLTWIEYIGGFTCMLLFYRPTYKGYKSGYKEIMAL